MNQTDPSGKCGEGANLVGPTQPCDFGLHAEIEVTAKDPGFIASTIFLVQETTAQLTPFGLLPATNEGLWKAYQDRQFLKAHPDWKSSVYADPVVIGLVNTGPISMDEAVSQGAAHVGGEGVVETTAKGTNLQFRNTTTNAAGQTESRMARFDVNPNDPHVQSQGPHLNLETHVNGVQISNVHRPIDPATLRLGDYP
jgi:hypothetical protein